MRVALVNAVSLNGGDAAIMLAIRRHVLQAFGESTEFVVHDSQPETAARLYPEIEFAGVLGTSVLRYPKIKYWGRLVREMNTRRWLAAARALRRFPWLVPLLLGREERRALDAYARADLAISTGGTYLVERYSLWPRIFEFEMLRALGVPIIFYTQSLGPFTKQSTRRRLRSVMDAASLVLLRDNRSRDHLLDIGVPNDRLHVLADAVFTFAADAPAFERCEPLRRVAVSVRSWPYMQAGDGNQRYVKAIQALVERLVRSHGCDVTFVSTCQGVPEYWTDDSAMAAEIEAGLASDVRGHVSVDRSFRRPEELVAMLESFDLLVSTRMHGAILGLCAGVPVLPIAYEFKTEELFARLGLGEFVQRIDDINPESLVEACERFWNHRSAVSQRLAAAVPRERDLADAAVGLIAGRSADVTVAPSMQSVLVPEP